MRRRALARRLERLLSQLDDAGTDFPGTQIESLLGRLERAVDGLVLREGDERAATSRASSALEAIPDGLVLWDEDGNEVYRNELAQAFAGARHGDALVEQAIQEELAACLHDGPRRRSLDVYGPPRRMLVVTAAPLDNGARLLGAVAVIEDVSERRRLESIRRDFVANISHELKTPVGALGLLAETIANEEDDAVVQRLANRMHVEALRVGRIVDDLLALSRIEAEEQPVREPVAVSLLVAEAVERVRSLADARGMTIITDGVGERHTVRGDRRQLASAVGNLLENACKYSDEGSSVEVVSGADGTWVEIAVVDHGIGIPAGDLERVFERFYRVDRARSRETGGTGLGLAIVRHVAASHRGEVRLESQEGVGSTFTLRLPAGPGPVAVDHLPAESA
jgi:two-component system sensor histidine kinase SenX3